MIIRSIKSKKNNKKRNKAFALLFSVMLSSIILAIALGVADVALQEIKFGTSAKDTNDAFFAADTGSECALYNDKSTVNSFPQSSGPTSIQCAGLTINLTQGPSTWDFVISGLGSAGQSCAKVNVTKTFSPNTTIITSKGYNNGGGVPGFCTQTQNSVERVLQLNY